MSVFADKQRRARYFVGSLAIALSILLAIACIGQTTDESTEAFNLVLDSVSTLPAQPIESGDSIDLSAVVRLGSSIPLESNALVEFSLRRSDKPDACVSEIALVPPSDQWTDGTYAATASIDTTDLSGGLYEVVATIRFEGYESTQYDNEMQFGFVTIEAPRPELHPISLSVDPAVPLQWGETATVHTTIENTGRLAAGTFYVVFSIRPQSMTGDGQQATPAQLAWIDVATKAVPGLARNAETQVSASIDLSAPEFESLQPSASSGDGSTDGLTAFDIRATVEYVPSSVSELDVTNNSIYGAFSVVPSTLGLPDLVPVSITYDEDLPVTWDRQLTATVTIVNVGGSDAPAGLCAAFSYRRLGEQAWTLIDPVRTLPAIPVEEGDNQTTVDVTLIDRSGIGPSGAALEPGSYELKVEVGCLETPSSCQCSGSTEQSTLNNTLIIGFSVRGTELQAESLEFSPMPITQGESVVVRATVVNTGNRKAQDFLVGFYLNGERFDTFRYSDTQGLAEDQRTTVQGVLNTSDLPPGTYDLRVIIDPDNRIIEFDDEGNNTISMPIDILAPEGRKAELQIAGVRLNPSSPVPQASALTATVTIRNAGEIRAGYFALSVKCAPCANGCTPDSIDWSAIPEATLSGATTLIAGLEQGEAKTIPISLASSDWEKGAYWMRVFIDPENAIQEMNEFNNDMEVSFTIGEPLPTAQQGGTSTNLPNLVFRDVKVTPSTAVGLGDTVSINATVVNVGAQSSGGFSVTLQWTTPTGASYTLLSQQVGSLDPGQAWVIPTVSVQTSLPAGPYAIVGLLDAANQVAESNEADNELRVAITVGQGEGIQPDLTPVSVRFAPSTTPVQAGQEILVYTTIKNLGALASGPFAVQVTMGDTATVETWPGLDPLQSVELVHSLGTPAAGAYDVVIRVDSRDQVVESNESNNSLTETLQVGSPTSLSVEAVLQGQGPLMTLALDSSTGTLYGAWQNGDIQATERNGTQRLIYSAGTAVSQMVVAEGVQDVAYLATRSGKILGVDLASGGLLVESVELGDPIVDLARGKSGVLYAATGSELFQLNSALTVIAQAPVTGSVVELAFESIRGTLYAVTSAGLFAFNADLSSQQCSVTDFLGEPTVLAVGTTGVFVGTASGVVRAFTFCQSTGSSGMAMISAWRYPASGSMGAAVTSITIDERDLDPIYVATDDGTIHALAFTGTALWTYQRSASGVHAQPAVDPRSGRFVYADDDGVPTVLESDGSVAFMIDTQASQGSQAVANLVVDEVRRQTESGMRLVRIYYFAADDGWIYRVETTR